MVDEKVIDKIIAPIIERQRAISTYTIKLIAQRVKNIGKYNTIDYLALYNESREDIRKLRKLYDRYAQIQIKAVKQAVEAIIECIYADTEELYVYREVKQIDIKKRGNLWLLLTDFEEELDDLLLALNISKNVGFVLDNTPMSIVDTYYNVVDKAVQAKSLNVLEYESATKSLLEDLATSEVRYIEYKAKDDKYYKPKLDYWIEQNLFYITSRVNEAIQRDTTEKLNCDGIELSAHIDSAPDHEPMQGHQFALGEFEKLQSNQASTDVNGNTFAPIVRKIGAWNCRHLVTPIIIGVSKPKYSQQELNNMIVRNAKGYTLPNGKHLTMYECRQLQNKYKRQIATAKNTIEVATIANNNALKDEYTAKLADYISKYTTFSKACGLPMDKY